MKNQSIAADLILASGAPGLLLLAFVFQLFLTALAPGENEPVGAAVRVVFMLPLFELLLMLAVIGLIWAMNTHRGFGRVVSVTYLALGLALLYSNALLTVLPLPESLYSLTIHAAPGTLVGQAAAALAALGLVSLWFWKRPAEAAPGEAV